MRSWLAGALACALALGLLACAIVDNAVDRTTMAVQGRRLLLDGEITSRTPGNFEVLLAQNPQVRVIEQGLMPGSLDDGAVRRMGYLIRDRGLDTHLGASSEIYSGAVDLFLAGNRRTMERGATIGVHAWADGFGEATEYPAHAKEHRANARYVRDMLGSDAFYWFTLQAAPANGIHEMTAQEILRYGMLTASGTD